LVERAWNSFRDRISMRGYLILLVFSVLLPVVVFAGIAFWKYYTSELTRIEEDLHNEARKLALNVDRELSGQLAILQTLGVSQRLAERDYAGFYRQAEQVKQFASINILLRALDGQHLVNTRVPWGTPLPRNRAEGDDEVVATKKPYITGVITGTVAQRPIYTITAPIIENDRVALFLNLSLELSDLNDLLKENIDPGRIAGILDQRLNFMARTQHFDEVIAKPAPASLREQAAGGDGVWRGLDSEPQMVRGGYARSKVAGWVIFVSLPEKAIQASLLKALWTLAALGALLVGAALLVAYALGGRLSRSIGVLADQAAALGRGEAVVARALPVREVNQVSTELAAAATVLREREVERDEAERELRDMSTSLDRKVTERTQELVGEMARRAETEETLRQVQKMEAIGQLTGGIAHDFNNMLAIVMGSIDLGLRRLQRGETAIEKHLTNAQDGARRAASLTQRLLAFARQQPLAPEPIDANKLVAGMSELLRRSLGETIQLETVLAGGLWRAHADANQLESAILNLTVNARDAMPEGGRLTIETGNAYLDDAYSAEAEVPAGQYVLVAVTDTGDGMSAEIMAKVFDPFFTTKTVGTGTGLGLSQVYGFVRQSGGHVKIYSEPGEGTTVKIYLPRLRGAAETRAAAAESETIPTNDGSVTVLVVEDEEGVRNHAIESLRELGYKVIAADSAEAALALIDGHPEIGVLFTDVVMPGMNGRRLSEEATRRRPALKVLFTTGYTRNAIVHNGMLDPDVNLLGKPFTLDQLARKVFETLRG
jgi:signal transduction histidine kinase